MSAYGYERDTTPVIEAFAKKAVLFERAYGQAASTAPALSSVMTSKYVHNHGVLQTYKYALSTDEETMAERLAAAGLTAAAFTGIGVLMPTRKLDQGFTKYSFTRYTNKQYWKGAAELTAEAFEWLDGNHASPFFLWIHYFEPHLPYKMVPEDWRERFVGESSSDPMLSGAGGYASRRADIKRRIDEYDGSLAYSDFHVGRVLERFEELGLLDSTMVIISADHGESLGEHGLHGHSHKLYESIVRIPLVVYLPGIMPARVSAHVEQVDILPTVLEWFGLERDGSLEGRVLPLDVRWEKAARADLDSHYGQRDVFAETWIAKLRRTMINTGRWKLIVTQTPGGADSTELYDLDADPRELVDLAASEIATKEDLTARLDRWKTGSMTSVNFIRQSPEEIEMLRALGYLQ